MTDTPIDDDEIPEPPDDFGHGQGPRDPDKVDDKPINGGVED